VQRVVDTLARDGLVARRPNPRHRRAPRIALTEAGRIAAAEDARGEADRLNALARELDPAALRAAARLLRQLHAALAPARRAGLRREDPAHPRAGGGPLPLRP
jgi:DNA-binding MarR family transcriptional regulator